MIVQHTVVVNLKSRVVWCYACDNEVSDFEVSVCTAAGLLRCAWRALAAANHDRDSELWCCDQNPGGKGTITPNDVREAFNTSDSVWMPALCECLVPLAILGAGLRSCGQPGLRGPAWWLKKCRVVLALARAGVHRGG